MRPFNQHRREMDKTKRICLWSGPRNISTALMYSFAQRSDTKVYDEPLYAHYLKNTSARDFHPGADEILASLDNDGERVIEMMMGSHATPVVFFKNMTHHLLKLDRAFMKDTINVILTRNPVEMLPSFAKVIPNPTLTDVGYQDHVELLEYLKANNIKPIVLDAKNTLIDPMGVLSKFCDLVEIPFEHSMLSWNASARPEDGVWAKYWYQSVHQSTGFEKYKPKTTPFPNRLKPLLEQCIPLYNQLKHLALE